MTRRAREIMTYIKNHYRGAGVALSPLERLKTCYRPYYGPVEEILGYFRPDAAVLEIGCGNGPIMFLLQRYSGIRRGMGIDLDRAAVEIARNANRSRNIKFEAKGLTEMDPKELQGFDHFLCFDVFHHVPAGEKAYFLDYLTDAMAVNSRLIFKDLDRRPWFKSIANDITDYLSSRSIVSYFTMDEVVRYLEGKGFRVLVKKRLDQLVWSHFVVVADKTC